MQYHQINISCFCLWLLSVSSFLSKFTESKLMFLKLPDQCPLCQNPCPHWCLPIGPLMTSSHPPLLVPRHPPWARSLGDWGVHMGKHFSRTHVNCAFLHIVYWLRVISCTLNSKVILRRLLNVVPHLGIMHANPLLLLTGLSLLPLCQHPSNLGAVEQSPVFNKTS